MASIGISKHLIGQTDMVLVLIRVNEIILPIIFSYIKNILLKLYISIYLVELVCWLKTQISSKININCWVKILIYRQVNIKLNCGT